MKLYYGAGSCALGIHVLLEEIGKPYEAVGLNLREGEHHKPPFIQVNPKAKVPTLERDDGSILTEFPAIAFWLARSNPDRKLLPDSIDDQARVLETIDYIVATVHMQGFGRLFRPGNFDPNKDGEEAVKARGVEMIEKGFAQINEQLAGKEFAIGPFSIADAALLYVELWADRFKIALPPNLAAHRDRMKARPSVQAVLKAEGLA